MKFLDKFAIFWSNFLEFIFFIERLFHRQEYCVHSFEIFSELLSVCNESRAQNMTEIEEHLVLIHTLKNSTFLLYP